MSASQSDRARRSLEVFQTFEVGAAFRRHFPPVASPGFGPSGPMGRTTRRALAARGSFGSLPACLARTTLHTTYGRWGPRTLEIRPGLPGGRSHEPSPASAGYGDVDVRFLGIPCEGPGLVPAVKLPECTARCRSRFGGPARPEPST
jgi:hypothetical protein